MKEICVINKGENIEKIAYNNNLNKEILIKRGTICGLNYVTIKDGSEDLWIVRNYYPYYIRKLKDNETLLDIYSSGFDVEGQICPSNKIITMYKSQGIRYTVGPLEQLDDIVAKFSVSKEYIKDINGLKTDKLFVGQVLNL